MNNEFIVADILFFINYVFENKSWAINQFLLGSFLAIILLLVLVWIDFGFILKLVKYYFSNPSLKKSGPRKVTAAATLDVKKIEEDDSLISQERLPDLIGTQNSRDTDYDYPQSSQNISRNNHYASSSVVQRHSRAAHLYRQGSYSTFRAGTKFNATSGRSRLTTLTR